MGKSHNRGEEILNRGRSSRQVAREVIHFARRWPIAVVIPTLCLLAVLLGWFGSVAQPAQASEPVDETRLRNVDAETSRTLSAFRLNRRTGTFFGNVTVTNTSGDALPTPMYLVVNSVTPSSVSVAGADGTTVSGKPFFDLTPTISGRS